MINIKPRLKDGSRLYAEQTVWAITSYKLRNKVKIDVRLKVVENDVRPYITGLIYETRKRINIKF